MSDSLFNQSPQHTLPVVDPPLQAQSPMAPNATMSGQPSASMQQSPALANQAAENDISHARQVLEQANGNPYQQNQALQQLKIKYIYDHYQVDLKTPQS